MSKALLSMLAAETKKLQQAGLYKPEAIHPGAKLLDFTSQDYLGLANDERIVSAARAGLDELGLGTCSPRGFTGTRTIHKKLEQALAKFLQVSDAITFSSAYLANIGLYESMFDSRDCLFCDQMVHPSTAEGVRLSGATTFPFRNNDVDDLEDKLKRSRNARFRAVVTDGVYPTDGKVAALEAICALAERYQALVIVDDSLGIGVLGETGRGTRELRNVIDRVDVVTGTFGKALGGAGGGFVAGKHEVIEWLRQKATPYLFSSALPPPLAMATLAVIEILEKREVSLATLRDRVDYTKRTLEGKGFKVLGGEHPTLNVFVGGVVPLQKMVTALFERDVLVSGLCFPVVPEREARIRLEISVKHTQANIDLAVRAFEQAGKMVGVPRG